MEALSSKYFTATRNACKLCTPLGATLAFKGIEGAVPLLHGSQGCSTYIRRYLISHFKEPVDIASSNFSEDTAIFGGGANLKLAVENVAKQYSPELIGIASTCLSETIGDDVPMILRNIDLGENAPLTVHVSTPSYSGTHMDGFHRTVRAVVDQLNPPVDSTAPGSSADSTAPGLSADSPAPDPSAVKSGASGKKEFPVNGADFSDEKAAPVVGEKLPRVNLFPGMLSPEDMRYLKDIFESMGLEPVLLPDYSERLDGPLWNEYQEIQKGGTPIESIRNLHDSSATMEFGRILSGGKAGAGLLLENRFNIPCSGLGIPVGIRETDLFFSALEELSGTEVPLKYRKERGRLIDAYVDGSKYLSGKKAVVYGEEDLVVGLVSFLSEIGIIPVLVSSGGKSGLLKNALEEILPSYIMDQVNVREGVDFMEIEEQANELAPDIIVGNSKGYGMSKRLNIPLVRVGFPIHDRIGGGRILHIGYRGAQQLYDTVVNTILQHRQVESGVGYAYM